MAENANETSGEVGRERRRTNTVSSVAHSVHSATHTITSAASELLLRDPPPGFFAATAQVVSHAPTVGEIRRGSFGADGWHANRQQLDRQRRNSHGEAKRKLRRVSVGDAAERNGDGEPKAFPALTEEESQGASTEPPTQDNEQKHPDANTSRRADHDRIHRLDRDRRVSSSGYVPPPTIPWTTSALVALKAFGKWLLTPFGFLITIYGLNVVAWGGMLFLLLCNASPAIRFPRYNNCNDINSPRRIWIEIDSQILNALFCVTGFGLIPWRFRDWWYLLLWRCTGEKRSGLENKLYGLRKLAGIYRGWVRLPGSGTLDELTFPEYGNLASADGAHDLRLPLPLSKRPDEPLTGIRAPPTALWKIDFFVYSQVANTFLQACLCGFMWGMTRYNRPSWATGFFIGIACVVAALGGLLSYLEGRKVKRVEGVRAPHPTRVATEEDFGEPVVAEKESLHIHTEKGDAAV
ncbi:hypothetical protein BAUCODRAFT_99939 [Baudoinia panamericana UAMH 10762]|uniref:Uncharacterized protein n=1 Tax=Baudoinia panamericana (strain UAMH 10762) TaxID=717646 RepID=M2M0Q3_BAUPA|nr:uncharacterized protein BAUCODRAFT_99939 [Baudoinia panamericana UAMH 10762]EMD00588.1 hypothetical protein BAUCODRAFT_99939 [Baudoinia panamericana UAMH 10762]